MTTVYVHFSNHFDLTWRRCWERDYVYPGGRYASYQRIEELCLLANLERAETGEGAYVVEQGLTLRAFLRQHPDALPRLKALYAKGLFEVCGAGEAIMDVNMCSFETLCRNLASGVRYCGEVLGMPPLLANHGDGFGSSAQFPQAIRQCGLPGICGMSYSVPDNQYWRGLDGSTVLVWHGVPGRGYFYDHCYHEPCRACHNLHAETCDHCNGTGLDLPQNWYPSFEPVDKEKLTGEVAQYNVCSEEMLPPENFSAHFPEWQKQQPGVTYRWGTPRLYKQVWAPLAAQVDQAPADKLASRVENNPVQTGCYVSRIKIKQQARRCEAMLYGWETALALTCPATVDRAAWEALFLELPLFFFHDAITGTHQDEAYAELLQRMGAMQTGIIQTGLAALQSAGVPATLALLNQNTGTKALAVFNPWAAANAALRIPLPSMDCQALKPRQARTADGRTLPVVHPWHGWSPAQPELPSRLVAGVGASARTRPQYGGAYIETADLPPLAWSELKIEPAPAPTPVTSGALRNAHLEISLGEHGIDAIADLATGTRIDGESCGLGGLQLEEDEGDPWGTRKQPAFHHELAPFTRLLGAQRFAGYQEAYYAGRYEPNLRFGREADPALFALEWQITVRLLDAARRVDFEFEIFWKSANRRVRALFPLQAADDSGWYSIPGGWLERPRYEQTETALWSPNGDWPALHFAAAKPPAAASLGWAVVNYGTPSTRLAAGRLQVSLLRSPGFGHCLERYAQEYPMPTSGIRDGGWHHFTLSLVPHTGAADMPRLAGLAAALNLRPAAVSVPPGARLPACPIRLEATDIELVAAKTAFTNEASGAALLRLLNLRPTANTARLRCTGGSYTAATTRLTEDHAAPIAAAPDGAWDLAFHAFEVKTVYLQPS